MPLEDPGLAPIDVVLPVHNEGASIAGVLREFHRVVALEGCQPIRFVVCEDGSTDDTVAVLQSLSGSLPIELLSSSERKGYSRAVVDGMRATRGDLVACVDSDGQCDPADLLRLRDRIGEADLAFGVRSPRRDPLARRAFSAAFGFVYRRFFPTPLRDPSCPYVLIRRAALERALRGNPGILPQGFWWEFVARAHAARLTIVEVPVAHRPRWSGGTVVYRPTKLPRIAWNHLRGLLQLRRELRDARP
jgi:dolichol-phosphate mannosyltransferase